MVGQGNGAGRHGRQEFSAAPVGRSVTPDVLAVLADLPYWAVRGILVCRVEPVPGCGVHLEVCGCAPEIEQTLDAYYEFPVRCSPWS